MCGFCTGAILVVLKIDKVGVITVIDVVDAEDPLCGVFLVLLTPAGTHIAVVIVRSTIAVALSVVVDPVVLNLVLGTGGGEGLAAVEDPGGTEHPSLVELIHGHDIDIVATVVVGIVPAASVHAIDLRLRP